MTQQPDPADASPALPALKIVEPEVDAGNPWVDDKLDRKEIADRLTTIVRGQEAPFVISLDGRWGTGKTFLLRRWAQDLQNQDPPWQAIYYNAWEDDFAGDPMLSMTGQLSEHFKKGALWAEARKLGRLVAPFVQPIASTASIATTGVPVPNIRRSKQAPPNHLADYLDKRAAKDELKKHLAELARAVREATGQPLVFIIDELDRCRPTFAIELLERVKHVFDVKNIVFVFGINQSDLTKSLQWVYGEIDADTYLRRFFDMPLVLPDADPALFCKHLVARYGIGGFASERGRNAVRELGTVEQYLPAVVEKMGLSLRDIAHCVRLISLAMRGVPTGFPVHEALLVLLVTLKIDNSELYRRFVGGNARAAEVIDYLNERVPNDTARSPIGERVRVAPIEAAAYWADDGESVLVQLNRVRTGREPDRRGYLAADTARLEGVSPDDSTHHDAVDNFLQGYVGDEGASDISLEDLAARIDLSASLVRR